MRLIDADEFKKQIVGMAIVNNYPVEKANVMCKLIDEQPTAYDVEKVIEFYNNCLNADKTRQEVASEIRDYIEARSGMKQTLLFVVECIKL